MNGRRHQRSKTYKSVFVRWDEIRPQCGLFASPATGGRMSVSFNHLTHKPYERVGGTY